MREKEYVILLTACVNPLNMVYTKLVDPAIRKKQYLDSVKYYYRKTKYKIVICNNTGDDFREEFNYDNERFEYIYFEGNNYNPSFGKGYGEFEIIKYALSNSRLIRKGEKIIKITGRLIIPNISKVLSYTYSKPGLTLDCVLTRFKRYDRFAFSECLIAPKIFFESFVSCDNIINDSNNYCFENFLYDFIHENNFVFFTLLKPLKHIGVSGTFNSEYRNDYADQMAQWMDIYVFLLNHQHDSVNGNIETQIKKVKAIIRTKKFIRKSVLHKKTINQEENW